MIDGHCHLDVNLGDCKKSIHSLYEQAVAFDMEGILLLNLPDLAFANLEVLEASKRYNNFFRVFPSVSPREKKIGELILNYKDQGAKGIKLHPRVHEYRVDSAEGIRLVREISRYNLPILIDCFCDGKNLAMGNTPEAFARLANQVKDATIAIGHSGGHRLLDALMVAKYYKNIYLDISYSLLYFREASFSKELAYVFKSIKGERIFWGTDYPDRPYPESVQLSLEELKKINFTQEKLKKICRDNVKTFLQEEV